MPHPPHLSRALGLGLALACTTPRPPEARPALTRTACPDTVAGPHDGVDLTHDVRRGPRAWIDSTGALRPLPAIPMYGDTRPCAQASDAAARSSFR